MKIAFYAGNCIPIHANTLEERPLGGTETALIRVSEILSKRGHEVYVFTKMQSPPSSTPSYYFHGRLLEFGEYDLLVVIQDWNALFYGARYKKAFFWTGDGWDQYVNYGLGDKRVIRKLDKFIAVSNWQATELCNRSGFPLSKTSIIGNGVHLPYFEGSEIRVRKRLIFASAPYRGLRFVPDIYLNLKKKHPELELHIFAGMSVYDTDKPYQGPELAEAQRLGEIFKKIPGVTIHGNVLQKQLAREMMKSSILIYPNSTFETCCIVALEAQAAGCPIVAGRNSALPESVGGNGVLIDGLVGSSEYSNEFINAVDMLLSDDQKWQSLSNSAIKRSRNELAWEHVVDRIEKLIN